MRYLAIDFGKRRIGLAICDDAGMFASPYGTRYRRSTAQDVEDIVATLRGLGATGIVFGLPRSSDGTRGPLENEARAFAAAVREGLRAAGLNIEIEWRDERFSTAEALTHMRAAGISQQRGRESGGTDSVDARAAAVILQGFLDSKASARARELAASSAGEEALFDGMEDN
ncbi:MAG TPA: Holliday junction resolvase RuvX [Abditibacteriaceae bacterium]|nr:Holliday junction resolvase RuvX [Abditibacteriaceae bacterium]